ncbi:MAG TPA: fumarylacetoacetate hydrolase family protein [Burkholderiales bacterium]|nr:fumarylacetoacetate hydrolase family protein [Burkholderiales bacterium]
MKLLRYGPSGKEKPGLLDADGNIRDLSKVVSDIGWGEISPAGLKKLAKIDPKSLPLVKGSPRLGVPYTGISKFVAIGLNYVDHAKEAGMPIPTEPILFNKWTTSICGPNDDTIIPLGSTEMDWEVEIAIVIGTRCKEIKEEDAGKYIAGYCVVNDVSERHFQLKRGSQWDRGKGCDTFGPIGPWLVTADEVGDPQNLDMWLTVNGERMQTGNTKTMIFGCHNIVAYCSQFMTLHPGDIITTGTPPGVGVGMKPPKFLNAGDVVELGIQKLGQQRQVVKAHP